MAIGPYRNTERLDVALASLADRRYRDTELATLAPDAVIPLPPPARAETNQPFAAFWVSPDIWFIKPPFATHENIAAHLTDTASITEQTDAWVQFDLTAPDLAPLLERLTNTDPNAPAGFSTRTVIAHLGCYLIKHSTGSVTVCGPKSSATSPLHAIEVAARSAL